MRASGLSGTMPSPTSLDTRMTRVVSISRQRRRQIVHRGGDVDVGAEQIGDPQRQAVDEDDVVLRPRRCAARSPARAAPRASKTACAAAAGAAAPARAFRRRAPAPWRDRAALRPPASPAFGKAGLARARAAQNQHMSAHRPSSDSAATPGLADWSQSARHAASAASPGEIDCLFYFRRSAIGIMVRPRRRAAQRATRGRT